MNPRAAATVRVSPLILNSFPFAQTYSADPCARAQNESYRLQAVALFVHASVRFSCTHYGKPYVLRKLLFGALSII